MSRHTGPHPFLVSLGLVETTGERVRIRIGRLICEGLGEERHGNLSQRRDRIQFGAEAFGSAAEKRHGNPRRLPVSSLGLPLYRKTKGYLPRRWRA